MGVYRSIKGEWEVVEREGHEMRMEIVFDVDDKFGSTHRRTVQGREI